MAPPATLYEAMYILDTALAEEQAAQVSQTLQDAVAAAGGEIVSDELFGRRRMAFPINGHTDGVYRLLYFRGDGSLVQETKHQFTLIEGIVRGMVVVANPKAIVTAKEKERPAEAAAPAAEEAEEAAPEPAAAAPPAETPAELTAAETPVAAEVAPEPPEPVAETAEPEAEAAPEE